MQKNERLGAPARGSAVVYLGTEKTNRRSFCREINGSTRSSEPEQDGSRGCAKGNNDQQRIKRRQARVETNQGFLFGQQLLALLADLPLNLEFDLAQLLLLFS
jgi:hypothetical protein